MGNTLAKTDTTADLLDEVARGLRLLRERLEAGKARWSMALVETRRPFDGWRWDRDAKEVGRSGEWVSWLNSPAEVALASETEWVLEVVNPNSISRSEGMPTTLAIHSGAVDRFTTERTDPSVAQYLREEIGDGSGFVLAVPFAGPVMDGAAWSLWAGGVGPPGPTMTYDRPEIRGEREALRFDHNGVRGVVFVGVGPLRITPPDSAAWTLAVGLRFDGEPPTADQAEGLWDHLDEVLVAAGWDRLERESRSRLETAETPSPATLQRFINNVATKVDPMVSHLLRLLDSQSLAIDSSAMRPWDKVVEEEVARLQRDEGDAAFEAIEGVRGPLLLRRKPKGGGEEVVVLTKESTKALMMREGGKGYRRNYGDIEFLERVVPIKDTDHTAIVRLSWNRLASMLSPDHRQRLEQQLRREEEEEEASLIKSDEAERSRRRRAMEMLGSMKDAWSILRLCIYNFGVNPEGGFRITLPRWELASRLGISDHDPGGLRRIRSALRLLTELRFSISTKWDQLASGEGVVVSWFGWDGSKDLDNLGKGNPATDIDTRFFVDITPGAVGTLAAYYMGGTNKTAARWTETTTLAPWVEGAAGFTTSQSRLWEFVRANFTRNRDHSRNGPAIPTDSTPREYGRDFCPLLPEGELFFGALGRFKHSPESGFTLKGVLFKTMGYDRPKAMGERRKVARSALADLRAVVVHTFGGVVALRGQDGGWMTLEEAESVSVSALESMPISIFVPTDFTKREVDVVEGHQRGRKDRGETALDVRVATTPEELSQASRLSTIDEGFRLEVVAARKRLRINQQTLADIIGVDRTQLSRWEKGERGLRLEARERLSRWMVESREGATAPSM